NLVALMTHTRHGDGVLVGERAHLFKGEGGGITAVAGILPYALDDSTGCPSPASIAAAIPENNVHYPQPTLLCLENTHNDCNAVAVAPDVFAAAAEEGHRCGLAVHLDGARVFNAAAAWGVDVKEYTTAVDSVQFCLSKGLGAPMGSMLCGSKDFIERARFNRKRIGGALRQAGFMAAAGIYALKHNVARLAEDHANAQELNRLLAEGGLDVENMPHSTNMVYFNLPKPLPEAMEFVGRIAQRGVLCNTAGARRVRLVTHLQVSAADVKEAADIICREAALK
ncbi:MAG: GntG family PLP-dependent aldolase, partial [Pyramidobacter sp.]|nr:GntG family PLP-dependent aldolase [Pyramidobacter sp.]